MDDKTTVEISVEDRLKAIVYQFILLHDRWSEERQVAAKQGADMADLLKLFDYQIKNFKTLESKVRQEITHTVQQSATTATKEMTEKISKTATDYVDASAKRLQQAVEVAAKQLDSHQRQIKGWYYWWMGSIFALAFAVGVFVVRLLMPEPYLPLTGHQLKTYENGRLLEAFWPKLSKKEKDRLINLANAKDTAQISNIDGSSDADDQNNI